MIAIISIPLPRFAGACLAEGAFWVSFENAVNWLTQPKVFITLATLIFAGMLVLYRRWTKPAIAGAI